MFTQLYQHLLSLDEFFWGYAGFSLIIFLGIYLTYRTGFYQLRALPSVLRTLYQVGQQQSSDGWGLHPLKAFCASAGGMLGVGNIVGIVTAIQIGGPGALLWVWVAGFAGSLIKYSEIYLGLKYRIQNGRNSYDGGPMFFLQRAFRGRWIFFVICFLLCIYGVEVYQFSVVVDTLSVSWGWNRLIIAAALLFMVFYAALGGVRRVATLCSLILPTFLIAFIGMSFWVIGHHLSDLPGIINVVIKSAFTGHAMIGGFAGSTILLAIQNGMAAACYSADIGIGYDSTIQSESRTVSPQRQARIAFFGVCLDNFICTLSILLVLVTGLWQTPAGSESAPLVQIALGQHFPYMEIVMPAFIFMLGYSTLIAYLIVGVKCARLIHPARGAAIYIAYSVAAMAFFTFFDQSHAQLLMRISGAILLIFNLTGIFLLRHELQFSLDGEETQTTPCEAGGN